MREIVEKLRADLAANKVAPLEVAKIVADLLPRSVSFNSIVDVGFLGMKAKDGHWRVAEVNPMNALALPEST